MSLLLGHREAQVAEGQCGGAGGPGLTQACSCEWMWRRV